MKSRPLLHALCVGALTLAQAVLASDALPHIPLASATQAQGDLPRLLRDALTDYETVLPDAHSMRWLEANSKNELVPHYWSERVHAFEIACAAQRDACGPLLAAQIKAMDRALREAGDAAYSLVGAATQSAISDLCMQSPPDSSFAVCGLSQRAHHAAALWAQLGRDAPFAHYYNRYQGQRTQYLGWLQSRGEKPSASTLVDLPELPAWMSARYFEATSALDGARDGWLSAIVATMKTPDAPFPLVAASYMARLSWRLNDGDAGRAWDAMIAAQPAQNSCPARSELLRIDIARLHAEGGNAADTNKRLRALIADNCPYTQALFEFASDSLQAPAPDDAALAALRQTLTLGIGGCDASGQCLRHRLGQLRQLLALTGKDAGGIAAVGQAQQQRFDQPEHTMLEPDLQMAWATAMTLIRTPTLKSQGFTLLSALQQRLLIAAGADRQASVTTQANYNRFDALHRTVARVSTELGIALPISHVEGLRAQTLLRRLRLESLSRQLSGVHDAQADADYAAQLEQAQLCRNTMASLGRPLEADWRYTVLRLAAPWCEQLVSLADVRRLETLATRKLYGNDKEKAWLGSLGIGALNTLDASTQNPFLKTETDSLGADEAYLSWLQVPGGYVASLAFAKADTQYSPQTHSLQSRFVPLSATQEATVALYRELLMAGNATSRGARRADALPDAGDGLRLKGMPVWRMADGSYVAQTTAPAGGVRAQSLKEIGQALYALLLAPMQAEWGGAKRLTISPDGPLAFLPFETLWAGDRQVLEMIDVAYVQSLAVHAELSRRAAQSRATQPALLSVADPDYARPVGDEGALPAWMAALRWNPLPGTRREADALAPLFSTSRTLRGSDASRKRFLGMDAKGEIRDFRVLHFATHGFADNQRSALVLSTQQGMQQAYLLDSDITTLRLKSDLVLLSACDTGLGRRQSGEGVMGLPYAFMLAGNTNTVMSLWPVDDAGAALFMPTFMKHAREGLDLVAALNVTKREFAAGTHGERNRDPRIWAAFVQYGVPLALAGTR
ncbi:CHAT domain-containing protein [Niveibacterium sp. COAC-50]|uniref:CHAT domain-containing protein n=1 Tax=Niveibacterium sp. COAC-50 TaxID=2729384 RepID=UPI001556591A|nr:CHAT domain-containing protein [Niveibacterium sp. COAC-50]